MAAPNQLVHSDDTGKGRVLDQGDDLVGHGGHDALDHLEQHHLEEDLVLGHAQHLTGFVLSLGDGFDAATVDLGEIAGVVKDERNERCRKTGQRRDTEDDGQPVVDDEQLDHQGRASDDPDQGLDRIAQHLQLAHGAEADDQPQRQGKYERQRKELDGDG